MAPRRVERCHTISVSGDPNSMLVHFSLQRGSSKPAGLTAWELYVRWQERNELRHSARSIRRQARRGMRCLLKCIPLYMDDVLLRTFFAVTICLSCETCTHKTFYCIFTSSLFTDQCHCVNSEECARKLLRC